MNRFYSSSGYNNDIYNGGNGNGNRCRFTNTATAQGYYNSLGSGTPTMVNGEDSVTLNCIFADIAKTADRESVSAGDRIRYTITFRNMSDREMYNVKITDNLSSYLTPKLPLPFPIFLLFFFTLINHGVES